MNKVLYLLLVTLCYTSCSEKVWKVTDDETQFIRLDGKQPSASAAVDDIIKPYREQMNIEMDEVVAELAIDLSKSQPESTMGNLVTEILKLESEYILGDTIDFAIQNNGGLRINSIAKGPLKKGKVFELMPFDNKLIILKANGNLVKRMFDVAAFKGGWPMTEQVYLEISDTTAVDLKIHGKPIDDEHIYSFAINDYIAEGGDNCFFLKEAERVDLNITVRDALLKYMKRTKGTPLTTKITGRSKLVR